MTESARHDLAYWHRALAEHQMPVFAHTARTILHRSAADDSSASELSRLILQDVSMTARVLRMANSIFFNPNGGKVTTVSRAIVLLGFDLVRDICLSISVIDTFLRGPHRDVVVAEMAHCFHAAMQAKALAELSGQKDTEEVFIAALLYHLGTLSFWCFAGSIDEAAAERLRAAQRTRVVDPAVEKEVLGFRLQDLTALLNREWKLSPLLAAALDPVQPPSPRSRAIGFGHDIARALAGVPGAAPLAQVLAQIQRRLNVPPGEARERIFATAAAAADAINRLGVPEAERLIPVVGTASLPVSAAPAAAAPSQPADAGLQLEILRELTQLMLEPRPDVNLMLEMVLEGLYRGVGMDHAVFALLTPDRRLLRAKFVLGGDRDRVQSQFEFPADEPSGNALAWALATGQPLWIRHGEPGPDIRHDPVLQALSGGDYFVMPLAVGGKAVGCLYADRGRSRRPLDDELFTQFKLFGQQARMGLAYLKH